MKLTRWVLIPVSGCLALMGSTALNAFAVWPSSYSTGENTEGSAILVSTAGNAASTPDVSDPLVEKLNADQQQLQNVLADIKSDEEALRKQQEQKNEHS